MQVLGDATPDKRDTFPVWQSEFYLDYLDYVMSEATCAGPNGPTTLGQHPSVVAIELMNEPHPLNEFTENGSTVTSGGAWTDYAQAVHVATYDTAIKRVRASQNGRPDIPIVLGAFYGGHLYDNSAATNNINWLSALTTPNFTATATAAGRRLTPNGPYFPPAASITVSLPDVHENLIWTAHNYFTGTSKVQSLSNCPDVSACLYEREGPDYDGNGLPDPDGIDDDGVRGAGLWTESFSSNGCYGYPQAGYLSCSEPIPNDRRTVAKVGHRANAWGHDRIAQAADMPFYMGEFGIGQRLPNQGWLGARQALCDKLLSYRSVRPETQTTGGETISWAVWAFDSRVDGGFGLYDPVSGNWEPHATPFSSNWCSGSTTQGAS